MDYTVQYYDLVLALIAGSLLVGVAIGALTAVSTLVSLPAMGLIAMAVVYHGLFVNGPVDEVEDLSQEADLLD